MSDDRLIRIEDKLDKVNEHLGAIDVTLASQHESLKEHIKRTSILEEELKPIKKHTVMTQGILKFLMYISGMMALIGALIKVLK